MEASAEVEGARRSGDVKPAVGLGNGMAAAVREVMDGLGGRKPSISMPGLYCRGVEGEGGGDTGTREGGVEAWMHIAHRTSSLFSRV